MRDDCEEQEDKCNEEGISSPENLGDGSEEQDRLNKGNISSPGKVRDGTEEQAEKLN